VFKGITNLYYLSSSESLATINNTINVGLNQNVGKLTYQTDASEKKTFSMLDIKMIHKSYLDLIPHKSWG
jgi:hypothetical protein